jgi:hypothetical protein
MGRCALPSQDITLQDCEALRRITSRRLLPADRAQHKFGQKLRIILRGASL